MNDGSVEKHNQIPQAAAPTTGPVTEPAPDAKGDATGPEAGAWERIQHDLKSALDGWAELNKTDNRKSPEEKKIEDIKRLLDELRSKLDNF